MLHTRLRLLTLIGAATLLILLAPFTARTASVQAQAFAHSSAKVTVFATGLNNPRGLKFGPDGNLYVAEGGLGGTNSTVGQCTQVVPPIGPYTGGFTSRISKISPDGTRSTVVDQLPSNQTSAASGGLVSGVSDIQFIDGTLYGMEAGAGCSHGLAGTDNTIFRLNADGSTTTVADLSAFLQANPIANADLGDFEPDGTWYSMVEVHDVLYATEPNHQEVDRITLHGQIKRVVDLSTLFVPPNNWQGATSIVSHDGNFYFGTLGTFPVTPGTIATGLTFPTAMTFDPDVDSLYVSNFGFGVPVPGAGQIVRIAIE